MSGGEKPAADEQTIGPVTARIINRNWADVRVYATRDGARTLLGLVTTGATVEAPIPPDLLGGGEIELVADPVGEIDAITSGPLVVGPGQTVEWTIRARPEQSTVTIR